MPGGDMARLETHTPSPRNTRILRCSRSSRRISLPDAASRKSPADRRLSPNATSSQRFRPLSKHVQLLRQRHHGAGSTNSPSTRARKTSPEQINCRPALLRIESSAALECVAGGNGSLLHSLAEPVNALGGAAVGEGLRADRAALHLLQMIVADRGCRT